MGNNRENSEQEETKRTAAEEKTENERNKEQVLAGEHSEQMGDTLNNSGVCGNPVFSQSAGQ